MKDEGHQRRKINGNQTTRALRDFGDRQRDILALKNNNEVIVKCTLTGVTASGEGLEFSFGNWDVEVCRSVSDGNFTSGPIFVFSAGGLSSSSAPRASWNPTSRARRKKMVASRNTPFC